MKNVTRRAFLHSAAALGASVAWAAPQASRSRVAWTERRDQYPEGVASGDPQSDSVLLWTRRPLSSGTTAELTVEISEDAAFRRVVSTAPAIVSAATDWTCRVLAGGLKSAHTYWYRFTDANGMGSRVG